MGQLKYLVLLVALLSVGTVFFGGVRAQEDVGDVEDIVDMSENDEETNAIEEDYDEDRSEDGGYDDEEDEELEEAEDDDEEDEDEEVLDDEEEEEETIVYDDDMPRPADDVSTYLIFPNVDDNLEFPGSTVIKAVIGVRNEGTQKYLLKHIEGSLRHPQQFSYVIQNFSSMEFYQPLEPGMDSTFLYKFKTHDWFEPKIFGFQLNLHYIDTDENVYQDAVYNDTITVVESPDSDAGKVFLFYVGSIVVAGLVGMIYYQRQFAESSGASSKRKGTTGDSNGYEEAMNLPSSMKRATSSGKKNKSGRK